MFFTKSTQRKHWLFTPQELEEKRREIYDLIPSNQKSVSYEDHLRYIRYYQHQIIAAGIKIGYTKYLYQTALALYQRLYTKVTAWDIPPQLALLSCLYIVRKLEGPQDLHVFLGDLCVPAEFYEEFQPEKKIPQVEIRILQALNFEYSVYLPFHEIIGFLHGTQHGSDEDIRSVIECAKTFLYTDVLLLFPPGQIALACIAKVFSLEEAESYIPEKHPADIVECITQILTYEDNSMTEEEVQAFDSVFARESSALEVLRSAQAAPSNSDKAILPP